MRQEVAATFEAWGYGDREGMLAFLYFEARVAADAAGLPVPAVEVTEDEWLRSLVSARAFGTGKLRFSVESDSPAAAESTVRAALGHMRQVAAGDGRHFEWNLPRT